VRVPYLLPASLYGTVFNPITGKGKRHGMEVLDTRRDSPEEVKKSAGLPGPHISGRDTPFLPIPITYERQFNNII
jgi:hypothetical protein